SEMVLSRMQNNPLSCKDILAQMQARHPWLRPPTTHLLARVLRRSAMGHNGIHHVTAIAGPAGRNLQFYSQTLGLRLIKRTVNFDDPTTYHLYFGDETGRPGTILTFFPWQEIASGKTGVGEAVETVLRVPEKSMGYWTERFAKKGVAHETPNRR